MFLLDPPPNFQGLDPDKQVTFYNRHLPHWRQVGATYFVTFRLADSIPPTKVKELKQVRVDWEKANPAPRSERQWQLLLKEVHKRLERFLDAGYGECHLGEVENAQVVVESLRHFDGERYELSCSVVMPNHVHLIVRPFSESDDALSGMTRSWKRFTALKINRSLKREGKFWQDESYDRIVRDPEHLWKVIQYIGKNPEKCDHSPEQSYLWITPEWEKLGWRFDFQ